MLLRRLIAPIALALTLLLSVGSVTHAQVETSSGVVTLSTYKDKSHASSTTAAMRKAIGMLRGKNGTLVVPAGDYLIDTITINFQITIKGAGEKRSRFYANASGALFTFDPAQSTSTGTGPTIEGVGFYSERSTSAAGDIGILITNTHATANNAFAFVRHVVVEGGFHDAIVLRNLYFSSVTDSYVGNYRRYGVLVQNTHSIDVGDHVIAWNRIQPIPSGGGYDANGCNIRLEQFAGTTIHDNKILPGHLTGISVWPAATYTTEPFPSGMLRIHDNNFDSFGSGSGNSNCVVIGGEYGEGGAGTAQHGNKNANIIITGNQGSNCGRLLEVKSRACYSLSVIGNHTFGGGGVKIATNAVVDGFTLVGNYFDNRIATTGAPSSSGSFGPSKAVEDLGTVTNYKASVNHYLGFSSSPDIVDDDGGGGSSDLTEASRQLAFTSNKLRVPGNTGALGNVWAITSDADTVTWAIAGDTAISDGATGVVGLHYSGTSAAPKFAAPSGYTLVKRKGDTLPTSVDNRHVSIPWFVQGTRIFYSIRDNDTIAALTTEGGGGGSTIMEDSFESSTGSMHGRTADVTAGPSTWVSNIFGVMTVASGYATASTEVAAIATYDAGTADVVYTVVTNQPSAASSAFPSIEWNYADGSNYWAITWRQSDGLIQIFKVVGGSVTVAHSSTVSVTNDVDETWVITVSGDDVTVSNDGTTLTGLTVNESSRQLKTNDIITIHNGNSGFVKFKNVKVESLP